MGYFPTDSALAARKRTAAFQPVGPKTHTPCSPKQDRGHRFYNPVVGRWVSRDPIGERGGDNLYSFVNNKSVNLIDAIGLVGTIAVTRFEPFTSDIMLWHVRGWLFTVIWTPPSDGDWDNPCECKPCKKALWLQTIAYTITGTGYLSKTIPEMNLTAGPRFDIDADE
jgi:RHS repeat-associated protein